MHLIFFTHPSFFESESMPRFTHQLMAGMKERHHTVELWTVEPFFYKMLPGSFIRKWMGYLDQYVRFPWQVKKRLKTLPKDALLVITDHALGAWVPLMAHRPHVIHCHDFIAQQSALRLLPVYQMSWTGKLYQAYIRSGFRHGKHFISVSKKTKQDLENLLTSQPITSEVVYNGLNPLHHSYAPADCRTWIRQKWKIDCSQGYLLHVGGNQWYKNRLRVVEIYNAWRETSEQSLPLLLIGSSPDEALQKACDASPYEEDIYFLTQINDEELSRIYSGARLLIFPSKAEGFGLPIAEAMACGCLVLTIDQAPMTEVAGDAAYLIQPEMELPQIASFIDNILSQSSQESDLMRLKGFLNVRRFSQASMLLQMEKIYHRICNSSAL
ncbi:glycosyltransferase family 1 protein [Siphonobacter sp. SORGH_AS_1065]|uniref:glycosyltransferase family 4 protein n=1 Tax=Siphonobacter sp. SORGH_AS_1065 TaxID=3041795 RepID=UPI00278A9A6A|nr:glycosyltransferase family 1 protein [Siphonobacter sp. SORGH_AS_1065]MDQ1085608.1 glycosyltransferase involved in cell wall biosynthesis [Siphonobacter sp. SORGH_AS_1065]